ncbi:hypothetical protein [Kribbella sp. CA-293567]|uniref:hypothetical protein n=1 Tax=Kribbella sp. CA-293567 TaxID=3002436 RepID=UPI0022DD1F36|nr:hypothetical protein [Kribbella sp. CA-293567]WBQ07140.1 hypothetical protein OX958_10145 [Kribbella sp. CA-293567]
MSRTDKTKPLWVRHIEHAPRAVHDHRFGPCDLPPAPTRETPDTRCRWDHPAAIFYRATCCAGCSVRGCVKERQGMNAAENRRSRYQAREEARRYVRD